MAENDETLTAGTLIDGARMYAAAADAVNERFPNALHVLSQLLGMCVELALKAYLRNFGAAVKDLRALGHDLQRLLDAAEKAGLQHTGSRHFQLSVLGANYRDRFFAYPQEGNLNVIIPQSLRETARALLEEVFIAVHGADIYQELRNKPGLAINSRYPSDINASAWTVDDSDASKRTDSPPSDKQEVRPTGNQ